MTPVSNFRCIYEPYLLLLYCGFATSYSIVNVLEDTSKMPIIIHLLAAVLCETVSFALPWPTIVCAGIFKKIVPYLTLCIHELGSYIQNKNHTFVLRKLLRIF